ncbi:MULTISPECIES: hypothetical protein [unclassified Akkermansia]|nr:MULTISPECIES: hypothetical protein [unclassified Akkermansia]
MKAFILHNGAPASLQGCFWKKTDGSGNTIMEETDVAGRPG